MRIYLNGDGIDGLAAKLARLGDQAKTAVNEMLMTGSDIVIEGLKESAEAHGHTPKTGDMIGSIQRKSAPKVTANGGSVEIVLKGSNDQGVRYGEIAAYLNYGTSKIPADHWFDNGADEAIPRARDAMARVLDSYLNR